MICFFRFMEFHLYSFCGIGHNAEKKANNSGIPGAHRGQWLEPRARLCILSILSASEFSGD